MADFKELKRIYRIEAVGVDPLISKLELINRELALQKTLKAEANRILIANKNDSDLVEKQAKVIAQTTIEIKKLEAEARLYTREASAMIKVEEQLKASLMGEAQAASLAGGSINQAATNYKSLLAVIRSAPADGLINWKGEQLGLEEAKTKLLVYKKTIDDFNRSLSPDGSLVGEYKTGILNAFKQLGLDSVIKDQKILISREINKLIEENRVLVARYKEVGRSGPEAFRAIEPTLERNIKRQKELEAQLKEVNTVLQTQGIIGSQVTSTINKGFRDMITAGLGAAGVMVGLQGVFSFMSASMQEFKEAELNTIRLQNALRNMGQGQYFDTLINQAEQLSKEIGFIDNDDIIRAQEKLITFGKLTGKQIQELIPTIIDLSASLGVSVPDAAGIVVKALDGSGRALKEYGIKVKDGNTVTENFNILQTDLKDRIEDSAKAFGDTLSGSIAKSEQKMKDLQKTIGNDLLPMKVKILEFVNEVVTGFNKLSDRIGNIFRFGLFGGEAITDAVANLEAQRKFAATQAKTEFEKVQNLPIAEMTTHLLELRTELEKTERALVGAEKNPNIGTGAQRIDQYKRRIDVLNDLIKLVSSQVFLLQEIPDKAKRTSDEIEKQRKERLENELLRVRMNEQKKLIELESANAKGLVEEETYEKKKFDIESEALQARMELLSKGNVSEKEQAGNLHLSLIGKHKDYNTKLYEIVKARIESQKDLELDAANKELNNVTNDPNSTEVRKTEALIKNAEIREKINIRFNEQMTLIDKTFSKEILENERARNKAIEEEQARSAKGRQDLAKQTFDQTIDQITEEESTKLAALADTLDKQIGEILESSKTPKQKKEALNTLKRSADVSAVDIEIAAQERLVAEYKSARDKNLVTQKEYNAELIKLSNLRIERAEKETKKFIDLEKYKEEALSEIRKGAEQLVQDLLDGVFENQQRRLDKENEVAEKRLELEEEHALAQAQSQSERDSIERQFEAKKREQEKIAFERNKQQKIKEIKIEAAVGAAKAVALNPPPSPVGLISALFVALQAAVQIATINQQQFAKGGKVYPILSSGKINVASNAPQLPSGDNVLAYVRTGEVILNKRQQQMLGGDETFRKLGVPGFYALGGRVLGESLQPPSNPSSFLNPVGVNTGSKEDLSRLVGIMIDLTAETSRRIDRISVNLDPRAALRAQGKVVKNDNVGKI